jgi:hypothetical protein
MKGLVKRIARAIGKLADPMLRPISRRFSAMVRRSTEQAIRDATHAQLGELLVGVAIARREVGTYRNETNLLLDSLVREVTRLQDELACLQGIIEEGQPPSILPIHARKSDGSEPAARNNCG